MDKHERQLAFEKQLIGLILKKPTYWEDLKLNDSYFYNQFTRELFRLIGKLKSKNKPLDQTTWQTLNQEDLERVGGLSFIYSCLEMSGKAAIDVLERVQKELETFHIAQQVLENAKQLEQLDYYDIEETRTIVEKINNSVAGISEKRKTLQEKLNDMHHKLMNKKDELGGIDTGYNNLNTALDGWTEGNLIVVGARPSMGKTGLTCNFLLKSAQKGFATTYVAAETGDYSILERCTAILGTLPVNMMKNPLKHFNQDQLKRYQEALKEFATLPISIEDYQDIREIRQLVRDRKREEPNKRHLIIIDHLGHLKLGNMAFKGNRNLEYEEYCKALKDIARDYGVVVMLLSQLSREVEKREDKRPMLSDLRDSGSIEAIADQVLFLYRENYYLEREGETPNPQDIIEIGVAKNRNGGIGTLFLEFHGLTMTVTEPSRMPKPKVEAETKDTTQKDG